MSPVAIVITNSQKTVPGGGMALAPSLEGINYIGRSPDNIAIKKIFFQAHDSNFSLVDTCCVLTSRKTKLDLSIRAGEEVEIDFDLERGEILNAKIQDENLFYCQVTILGFVKTK